VGQLFNTKIFWKRVNLDMQNNIQDVLLRLVAGLVFRHSTRSCFRLPKKLSTTASQQSLPRGVCAKQQIPCARDTGQAG